MGRHKGVTKSKRSPAHTESPGHVSSVSSMGSWSGMASAVLLAGMVLGYMNTTGHVHVKGDASANHTVHQQEPDVSQFVRAEGTDSVSGGDQASIERDVLRLQVAGFIVASSRMPKNLMQTAALHVRERFALLLAEVAKRSEPCHIYDTQYSFSEFMHRDVRRWDMRVPDSEEWWHELMESAMEKIRPVLAAYQRASGLPTDKRPKLIQSGVLVSRPGATLQALHADGMEGLFSVFIPLVDVPANTDGTEFWRGSHIRDARGAPPIQTRESFIRPALAMGSILMYSFRTIQRGLANPVGGRERPMIYMTVAADLSAKDEDNFPSYLLSVFDPPVKGACTRWEDVIEDRPMSPPQ